MKNRYKKWREDNPEKVRLQRLNYSKSETKKKYMVYRKLKLKKFLNRVKMKFGCQGSNCHYKSINKPFIPEVLHFDHIKHNTKKYQISKMYNISFKRVKEEIRKCQILCANCHIEKSIKYGDFHTKINNKKGGK